MFHWGDAIFGGPSKIFSLNFKWKHCGSVNPIFSEIFVCSTNSVALFQRERNNNSKQPASDRERLFSPTNKVQCAASPAWGTNQIVQIKQFNRHPAVSGIYFSFQTTTKCHTKFQSEVFFEIIKALTCWNRFPRRSKFFRACWTIFLIFCVESNRRPCRFFTHCGIVKLVSELVHLYLLN